MDAFVLGEHELGPCLLGLTKERVKMHHVSLLGSGVVSDP